MAQSQPPKTWQRGFAEPAATATAAWADRANYETEDGEHASATVPEEGEKPTSDVPNDLGRGSLRSWPELYNGTEAAETTPVCACEKTVVMVKQPGHLTSMKNDRGPGTRVCQSR